MENQDMKKKIRRFWICGICIVSITCVVVFLGLTIFMSRATESSLTEISNIYMSEMNVQLQQKFNSIVDLRLDQVDGILESTSNNKMRYDSNTKAELEEAAEIRGFTYLGLYTEEGLAELIMGEQLNVIDYGDIMGGVNHQGKAIGYAKNRAGDKFLLLAVEAEYQLSDGNKSKALIAGVSMEYLAEALYLETEDSIMYSHIIAKDGTFVIRNSDAYRENYFERVNALAEEYEGTTAKDVERGLKQAIKENKSYSTVINVKGEKTYLFCSLISDNMVGWYLISVMPAGKLEETVAKLDAVRMGAMIVSVAILFIVLTCIFCIYYRLSRQQLNNTEEAKKKALRASMAKSEFLSNMSHDIRTPMNAIIGMTEIALKNINDPKRLEDCLGKVKLSSKHLLGLINDVLDMSKIESGKMTLNVTITSLREAMDDIVNIMQPQLKTREQLFDIFISGIQSEMVYCDGVRLNQVLLNLLSNAVKFTSDGGRIDVYMYQEESIRGSDYIQTHFIVQDTGIGMSEEFQKKVFSTFEREDNEKVNRTVGAGLGMSIAKSIVTLMGGTIEVESKRGQGTKFHVTLDLRRAEEQDIDMALPDWNVLVVDDNEALCISACENLKELGVNAEWTLSGRAAVDMIEEHHKAGNDYQFVLIDWKMPEMDGVQALQEIQNRVGKIPVFLISAYDWSDIEAEISTEHIEGFISKPLFKSTLYSHLNKYANGEQEETVNKQEEFQFEGIRMLLAEDIDLNWEIAEEILSTTGLVLERAENGLECLEKFEQSDVGYYKGILMDVRMPVMDGYEATKRIRALDRPDSDLPIIAMTADAFSDDAERCFESGMDAHLTKPLDIKECMMTLQKYLSD